MVTAISPRLGLLLERRFSLITELCMRRAVREDRDPSMCFSVWSPEEFESLQEHFL
jgi:hypothetical protein